MEDNTTTVPPVSDDTGAQDALPVADDAQVTADVTPNTEPSEPSEGAEAQPSTPEVDDKLQTFAKSQGIELDSPSAIKAAQIALKAQSEATRNYKRSNELEKGMTAMGDASAEQVAQATGQDPEVLKRIQRMEIRDSIRSFYDSNPDAGKYEARMTEIAQTAGLYGTPEAILKASYAMAKAESDNSAEVKSQAKKEVLSKLAHTQQAAVPTGHATNSAVTPKAKPFAELSIAEMEAKLGFHKR